MKKITMVLIFVMLLIYVTIFSSIPVTNIYISGGIGLLSMIVGGIVMRLLLKK